MPFVRNALLALALLLGAAQTAFAQTETAPADVAAPGAGSELEGRVQQLEEQLLDMQVVTGTLQSLAKGGGAVASEGAAPQPSFGESGDVAQRVDGLEAKMQALAGQVQQLSRQVQALSARLGSNSGDVQRDGFDGSVPVDTQAASGSSGFGETTIDSATGQAAGSDAIGDQIASLGGEGDPNQQYEEAYGYMLQQDYPSAEQAFTEFLARHPDSKLAGNAQFWLGESYYVRGLYKQAADAFLKGYKGHRSSQKAPDSLLKLAMSLSRLGEQKAACSGFARIETEFPNASAQVKGRAASERQRAGC